MKKYLFILNFFLLTVWGRSQTIPESYRHHFVIVVDQGSCQNHENMAKLYDDLTYVFDQGSLPQEGLTQESISYVDFNPMVDEVSIFASGITYSDYSIIYNLCKGGQVTEESINNRIVSSLFHPVDVSYRQANINGDVTIKEYFVEYLKPLMTKANNYYGNIRAGLNAYLYPLMIKSAKLTVPSEDYYFIRISSFTSQGALKSVKEQQLKPMLAYNQKNQKYVDGFDKFVNSIKSPYYTLDVLKMIKPSLGGTTNSTNTNNNPVIEGAKLGLVSLQGVGLKNLSIPEFNQKVYKSEMFGYKNASIQFTHDDHLKLQSVYWIINDDLVIDMTERFSYDQSKSTYDFPSGDVALANASIGDVIKMKYLFYMQSYDEGQVLLLPMVFKSECQYQLGENNFAPEPIVPSQTPKWYLLALGGVVAALLVACLLWWRRKRGERRKVAVEFDILPISNTRYMNVEGNKVVNLDCWYMETNKDIRNITIEGRMQMEDIKWAKKYNYRLEYWVEDCDTDDMFTFRPKGDDGGRDRKTNEWYEVRLREDNSFEFMVQSFMDKMKHPELNDATKVAEMLEAKEHIHQLKVMLRVRILKEDLKDRLKLSESDERDYVIRTIDTDRGGKRFEKHYSYIVRPYYQKSDAWVSFDPGTTGSCVALGSSGLPIDMDNIHVALNKEGHAGDSESTYNPIFPSKIRITDRSRVFKEQSGFVDEAGRVVHVEDMEEGADNDFTFGNDADNRLGNNIFQSIKKLLGFQTTMKVHDNKKGCDYEIMGKDLAHLIVKGLYNRVEEYIRTDDQVKDSFRRFYLDDYGRFCPQRAIVAVPNNYTISKVQEMVDTIKRIGKFKEVHYLYESEAVLMTYCRKEYANLPQMKNNIVVVFDMGGATINATAFSMSVKMRGTEIDLVSVETISKIGYCFGGDDVDYYVIRSLYGTEAIRNLFVSEDDMKNHMLQYKQQLIKLATRIKLDEVANFQHKKREFSTYEEFVNEVAVQFEKMGKKIDLSAIDSQRFFNEFSNGLKKNLEEFVYPIVRDAVKELVISLDNSYRSKNVILVFSGRSSAFPGIKSNVEYVIKEHFGDYKCWEGFNDNNGNLDVDKIKTAVAIGANWYALFSKLIRLEHNLVPTTIGFIDLRNNKRTFASVIEKNQKFENSQIMGKQRPSEVLNEVEFVQMQGSDYKKILSDYYGDNASRNRHKLNKLELVRQSVIDGKINEIRIVLDDKNNLDYEIISNNTITKENNPYSLLTGSNDIKLEIADENNESYVYALSQYQEEVAFIVESAVDNNENMKQEGNKKKRVM